LTINGKALSTKFKKIGSLSSTGIKAKFDFGGCKIVAHLESKIEGPYVVFTNESNTIRFFPVSAKLSHNGFVAMVSSTSAEKFSQTCTPKFTTDGDSYVIDVKIALGEVATFFNIEFNGAKLYINKQDLMKIGSILLIATGSFGGLLLAARSVIAIFYCVRHEQIKNKPIIKASVKDSKKAPIASKSTHVAIQVDSPAPKTKSHSAMKKSRGRTKTASEEQAPKQNAIEYENYLEVYCTVKLTISGSPAILF